MKIGLNATCFNDRPSGARQRFVGIYGELIKQMPEEEFVIFEPVDCRVAKWFDDLSNISAMVTPIPSEGRRVHKVAAGIKYWPNSLSCNSFNIFEGFNLPLARSKSGQTLLTIHDVRSMHPENSLLNRVVYKKVLSQSLKAADHVVTVSETSKDEILSFFPNISISVIHNGLNSNEFNCVSELDLSRFKKKYNLPKDFLLAVGHLEKRKNYLQLIDAIELLHHRGISCQLLIVGNDSGYRKSIEARVTSANLEDSVTILSGLTDLEVRCAYKLSSLFVFPSSYEGFGIPILEAMAAGRPMVLSDIPVFREITQDKGVYFAHNDAEEMAIRIEQVLTSKSEQTRLIEYGNIRIQSFSFQKLAHQVEKLYQALH